MAGSNGRYMCNFLRKCQTISKLTFYPINNDWEFHLLHSYKHLVRLFNVSHSNRCYSNILLLHWSLICISLMINDDELFFVLICHCISSLVKWSEKTHFLKVGLFVFLLLRFVSSCLQIFSPDLWLDFQTLGCVFQREDILILTNSNLSFASFMDCVFFWFCIYKNLLKPRP